MKQRYSFEFMTVPMCARAKNEKKLLKMLNRHTNEMYWNLRWMLE